MTLSPFCVRAAGQSDLAVGSIGWLMGVICLLTLFLVDVVKVISISIDAITVLG